jgi:hypothetical protein
LAVEGQFGRINGGLHSSILGREACVATYGCAFGLLIGGLRVISPAVNATPNIVGISAQGVIHRCLTQPSFVKADRELAIILDASAGAEEMCTGQPSCPPGNVLPGIPGSIARLPSRQKSSNPAIVRLMPLSSRASSNSRSLCIQVEAVHAQKVIPAPFRHSPADFDNIIDQCHLNLSIAMRKKPGLATSEAFSNV